MTGVPQLWRLCAEFVSRQMQNKTEEREKTTKGATTQQPSAQVI